MFSPQNKSVTGLEGGRGGGYGFAPLRTHKHTRSQRVLVPRDKEKQAACSGHACSATPAAQATPEHDREAALRSRPEHRALLLGPQSQESRVRPPTQEVPDSVQVWLEGDGARDRAEGPRQLGRDEQRGCGARCSAGTGTPPARRPARAWSSPAPARGAQAPPDTRTSTRPPARPPGAGTRALGSRSGRARHGEGAGGTAAFPVGPQLTRPHRARRPGRRAGGRGAGGGARGGKPRRWQRGGRRGAGGDWGGGTGAEGEDRRAGGRGGGREGRGPQAAGGSPRGRGPAHRGLPHLAVEVLLPRRHLVLPFHPPSCPPPRHRPPVRGAARPLR